MHQDALAQDQLASLAMDTDSLGKHSATPILTPSQHPGAEAFQIGEKINWNTVLLTIVGLQVKGSPSCSTEINPRHAGLLSHPRESGWQGNQALEVENFLLRVSVS